MTCPYQVGKLSLHKQFTDIAIRDNTFYYLALIARPRSRPILILWVVSDHFFLKDWSNGGKVLSALMTRETFRWGYHGITCRKVFWKCQKVYLTHAPRCWSIIYSICNQNMMVEISVLRFVISSQWNLVFSFPIIWIKLPS